MRSGPPSDDGPELERDRDTAERRQLTVLFCDLVGSTALSEQMDPEDLRFVLRDYQQRCAAVLRRYDGHIAQYLGDGLMVYFGYPNADEAAPRRAVEAGLGVLEAMAAAKKDTRLPKQLGVRVGIHTGPVVVGDMGDVSRPERLAVGATPNLAARVQGEAEPDSVLLSDATHSLVAGYFDCQSVGARQLRGISRPMNLHRVLGTGPASTRLEASEQRGFSPFAGRERELSTLVDRWTQSRLQGKAVLVSGEPGSGKSRLVLELTRAIEGREVVQLTASEYAQSEPLSPIVGYLEKWAGLSSRKTIERRRETLAARLDEIDQGAALKDLLALLSLDEGSPQQGLPSLRRHASLIHCVAGFFSALARTRPLLVLIEDLQWADASTRQFLEAWLDRRRDVPALTVATTRPGAQVSWAQSTGFELLALGPLEREKARGVARSLAHRLGADLPDDLLERVLDRADGVPLFVEELTRTLAETSSGPPSSRLTAVKSDPVPASLQDSLMARLDRLGPAKAIAQLAAVVGREVPLSWLEQVSPVGADALRVELGRLAAAGLVKERSDPEPTFAFTHALMQQAAYESLVRGAREELHQRVAEMLVAHRPDLVKSQPLLLARHYIAAGATEKAVRCLSEAGQRILTRSALAEATDVLRRALELLPNVQPSPARDALEVDVLSSLGLALISTRGYSSSEVEEVYSRARQLCERSGDVPLRVLYGVWAVHLVRVDLRSIHRLAARFERIVETSHDRGALLVAHSCLGVRAFYRMAFAEAKTHCRAAWELVDVAEPKAQHQRLLAEHAFADILSGPFWLSFAEAWEGNELEARRVVESANLLAERIGDPQILCQAACYSAHLLCLTHRVEEARGFAARAMSLSVENELYFWHAVALCAQGWVILQEGRADEATTMIQMGLSTLDAIGSVLNRTWFACYLIEAHLTGKRHEESLRVADEALALCREIAGGDEPELLRLRGEILVDSGSNDQGGECFRAALAGSRLRGTLRWEIRAASSLGRLLVQQGKRAEARDVLATSCRKWREGCEDHDAVVARAQLAALEDPTDRMKPSPTPASDS
ncbi:MAG: ATP-binding protein [Polyangiaceae bacterium]|jgi:class 3 adenylate cyclase/tetratricopeptide (TPR) repeat protein